MINKVTLVGYLGADPVSTKFTKTEGQSVKFSVATSDTWTDKRTGERTSITEWHNVNILNQGIANIAMNYLKKGSKVYIEGSLKTRKWTDKSNIERYTTDVVLNNFSSTLQMLDPRQDSLSNTEGTSQPSSTAPQMATEEPF